MGYKYNIINFNHELITECPKHSFFVLTMTSEERMCICKYMFIIAFIQCIMLYITYTNRIINGRLSSFSVFSVDNIHPIHPLHLFLFKATSLCVWLSEFLEKRAIFINCPIKGMYYVFSVSDMIVKSLSAFPLQILLSEGYNYRAILTVPLQSSNLRKCYSIRIYFQISNT